MTIEATVRRINAVVAEVERIDFSQSQFRFIEEFELTTGAPFELTNGDTLLLTGNI